LEYVGEPLSEVEMAWAKALASHSSHPLSRMIAEGGERMEVVDFQEHTSKGIEGKIEGNHLRIGSAAFVAFGNNAPAGTTVLIEINGVTKGGWVLRNRYRSAAWPVVGYFKNRAKTFLLSGDNEQEKEYLLPRFAPSQQLAVGSWQLAVHFNQSPHDKLDFIKKQQTTGETVLMLGDGLNDAGALRQADVGIVVAEDVNNFTPACDAVLDAKQFGQLPDYLEFAKKGIYLVYAAWLLAALYNVVGLWFAVRGELSPVVAAVLMPLSSLTIVGFGLASTTIMGKFKLGEVSKSLL
jgi:Cu+-exporting ATPase